MSSSGAIGIPAPGPARSAARDLDPDVEAGTVARPAPSGIGRVEAVLDALADLDGRPVEEHLGVFEAAHDELRAALDDDDPDAGDAGDDSSGRFPSDSSGGRWDGEVDRSARPETSA